MRICVLMGNLQGATLAMCGTFRPSRSLGHISQCSRLRYRGVASLRVVGRGVVLDPFSGSGTTGKAAAELACRYIGIDINPGFLELSLRTRLKQPSLTAHAALGSREASIIPPE